MDRYILQKDIPGCKAGTLFVHDKKDTVYGSIMEGCLKLAWTDDGNCQKETNTDTAIGLCGGTIIFHASVLKNEEWFKKETPVIEGILDFKNNVISKLEGLISYLKSN
jgi:hypothetical protein